jgi:TolB-like protein
MFFSPYYATQWRFSVKKISLLFLCMALVSAALAAKDNLAVLPFSGGAPGEGETIAELFSFSHELNEVFSPIPRTSIARAISNEQNFQTGTGMTDPDTIAAIGKQLGANYVVAGNITRLGNLNLLIISILKIDDLRQVSGDIQTYARIEDIQGKLPGMARNIISATQRELPGTEKLAVVPLELGGNIDSQEADTLAQILSINLIRSGKYLVYPRTASLEQVQTEYKTQLSGVTADESMVNIGRGENPRFVLAVAARRLGSQNMFNASIINLETGVQLIGRSVNYNTLDDGIRAMESVSGELTGVIAEPLVIVSAEKPSAPARVPRERTPPRERPPRGTRQSGGAVFGYSALNLMVGLGSFVQGDWAGGVTVLLGYGGAAGLIFWELSLKYEDELAGIPGAVGLGVAGLSALYGFIRPAIYNMNRPLAKLADGVGLAVVSDNRGGDAVRLSYTLKF